MKINIPKPSNTQYKAKEFEEVSLLSNPIVTLTTLFQIIFEKLLFTVKYLSKSYKIIFSIIFVLLLNYLEHPFVGEVTNMRKIFYNCLYWIILGIASSVGLGTGLHTFVLYLGPHIAKVTLAANECAYFPEMNPSRWEFQDFLPCNQPRTESHYNSFFSILMNVQLEAFMWGVGTAIGELPPYFMALGASKSGEKNEEIEEIENESHRVSQLSLIEKAKVFIYSHLQRHGFLTVLLCASVSYKI